MTAAQAGDRESYQRLLCEIEAALGPYLRRLLGARELHEDCLQECLLAIHNARHTYDASRPFKPWAYTLARYKAIDTIRRSSTRRRYEPDGTCDPAEKASVAPVEPSLDTTRALDGLDPKYREAVLLTKLEGYTVEEAAAKIGITRAAMRSRVHRGLRHLRAQLAQHLR